MSRWAMSSAPEATQGTLCHRKAQARALLLVRLSIDHSQGADAVVCSSTVTSQANGLMPAHGSRTVFNSPCATSGC